MLTAKREENTFKSTITDIRNTAPERLGNICVKYLEPINIQNFLEKEGFQNLNALNLMKAA